MAKAKKRTNQVRQIRTIMRWAPHSSTGYHQHEDSGKSPDPLPTLEHNVDPRLLFANRFWGRRRYSDSVSQLPQPALTAQASWQDDHGHQTSSHEHRIPLDGQDRQKYHHHNYPATPSSTRSLRRPLGPPPPPQQHQQQQRRDRGRAPHPPKLTISQIDLSRPPSQPHPASITEEKEEGGRLSDNSPLLSRPSATPHPRTTPVTPSPAPGPGFLHIPGYAAHAIGPRRPMPLPTRRDDLAAALAHVHAEVGPVALGGLDGLARPGLLSPLFGNILNLGGGGGGSGSSSSGGAAGPRTGRRLGSTSPEMAAGKAVPAAVDERELRRLESEVFDTAKYVGVGDEARHLTVLTWSEDSAFGTVTLLEGYDTGGRDVHVVVLVPDGARWAAEHIFWADDNAALPELRQKKYRDAIDNPKWSSECPAIY
ncbi:hypothetical protein VTG60DRAFT_6402 [Thermothelomyces hinnuleus]